MMFLWMACTNGFVITEGSSTDGFGGADLVADSNAGICDDRTGGALFSFVFGQGREMDVWVEDDDFIDWHLAGQPGWPVFDELIEEVGCDEDYAWHPSPTALQWVQDYSACSDEVPISSPAPEAPWCVTTFEVTAVDDRR